MIGKKLILIYNNKNMKTFKQFINNINEVDAINKDEVYVKNINNETLKNENYRNVVFTANDLQLVYMNIKPGEEIGEEVHKIGDQFLRLESGNGKAILNDIEYKISDDFCIIIPAGVKHNIINTGNENMKLYSIYTPPEHDSGLIEKNKIIK